MKNFEPTCREEQLASEVKQILNEVPSDFGGGCSTQKAILIAELIRTLNMTLTIDIGVYRGRSLFPQALAHREYTGGIAIGVDPWSAADAKQLDNKAIQAELDAWSRKTDFEKIYTEVCANLERFNLGNHCRIIRKSSTNAVISFQRDNSYFDLIHIDGNHDTEPVMADLSNYLPHLALGGILILDDISWSSVKPAFDLAKAQLKLLIQDEERDYAVLSKSPQVSEQADRIALLERLHAQALSAVRI